MRNFLLGILMYLFVQNVLINLSIYYLLSRSRKYNQNIAERFFSAPGLSMFLWSLVGIGMNF